MSRSTREMRSLAARLAACEAAATGRPESHAQAAFQVCEKLRPTLAPLMGRIGFGALVARARALALAESPCLQTLRVAADGSLEGLNELESRVLGKDLAEGGIALLAHLSALLDDFIGEALTRSLLRETWPNLPHDGPTAEPET